MLLLTDEYDTYRQAGRQTQNVGIEGFVPAALRQDPTAIRYSISFPRDNVLAGQLSKKFLIEALSNREMDVSGSGLGDAKPTIQRFFRSVDSENEHLRFLIMRRARGSRPDITYTCEALRGKYAPVATWPAKCVNLRCVVAARVDAARLDAKLSAVLVAHRREKQLIEFIPNHCLCRIAVEHLARE
jgi:hypothetical protein